VKFNVIWFATRVKNPFTVLLHFSLFLLAVNSDYRLVAAAGFFGIRWIGIAFPTLNPAMLARVNNAIFFLNPIMLECSLNIDWCNCYIQSYFFCGMVGYFFFFFSTL